MFGATLTGATLATLLLEFIKWVVRKVKKDEGYDFPVKFYLITLPILEYLMIPVLVFIGAMVAPDVLFDWQTLVQIVVGSLASVFIYNNAVAPLKEYNEIRNG